MHYSQNHTPIKIVALAFALFWVPSIRLSELINDVVVGPQCLPFPTIVDGSSFFFLKKAD